MAFRLAWSESWGLIVGTDAYDWQRDFDGGTAHSGGDATLVVGLFRAHFPLYAPSPRRDVLLGNDPRRSR